MTLTERGERYVPSFGFPFGLDPAAPFHHTQFRNEIPLPQPQSPYSKPLANSGRNKSGLWDPLHMSSPSVFKKGLSVRTITGLEYMRDHPGDFLPEAIAAAREELDRRRPAESAIRFEMAKREETRNVIRKYLLVWLVLTVLFWAYAFLVPTNERLSPEAFVGIQEVSFGVFVLGLLFLLPKRCARPHRRLGRPSGCNARTQGE